MVFFADFGGVSGTSGAMSGRRGWGPSGVLGRGTLVSFSLNSSAIASGEPRILRKLGESSSFLSFSNDITGNLVGVAGAVGPGEAGGVDDGLGS